MAAGGGRCEDGCPLFETTTAGGRLLYKVFAASVFAGVCLIWVYRVVHVPPAGAARRAWLGLLAADVWFGLYWVLTQSVRWNPSYRRVFRDRLSSRYEKVLPRVDVFVCTADPTIEPPALVIGTVLSVMAYDYPPERLAVYLSDDGGSDLTFYALLEASRFASVWIPFCRKLNLEPRSPAAYFRETPSPPPPPSPNSVDAGEWCAVQRSFEEMESKIETACRLGRVPEDARTGHGAFLEHWSSGSAPRDHPPIVQILIDGRDPPKDVDGGAAGNALPTLVYMAREKRPHRHHNFKAGAMNSLLRVSSEISKGEFILNVDCDMYSNDPRSVRDALCFFLDEEKGHEVGYVQFPQKFNNISRNDIYGSSLRTISEVDFHGMDGLGGPLYIGSGCFHRRRTLLGESYGQIRDGGEPEGGVDGRKVEDSTSVLEQKAAALAVCTFEDNTQWGKEVGLKYGCPVEDVITGLSIQCRGWKSVYFNPARAGFVGVAPLTLEQALVQHKRWSEGDFQIFCSRHCPFLYGRRRRAIPLGLQMAYCIYCLWAPNSLPTLYYSVVPALCLLRGVPLFPKVSSSWFIPFAYVMIATLVFSAMESLRCGYSVKGWMNEQTMWLFKRTTSYLFAAADTLLGLLGFTRSAFVVTAKVAGDGVAARYRQELVEFGSPSVMFAVLATLALLNLAAPLAGGAKKLLAVGGGGGGLEELFLQIVVCGLLAAANVPVYQGMFLRKDGGRMPTSVTLVAVAVVGAVVAWSVSFNPH